MVTKESAFQKISQLVNRFSEQIGSYKHSDYNETLTRRDFIDPFFKALGWDMDNEQGNAEAYREVIHEDKIKIGSATKAPDYSFRLAGGKRLFFVEAKKPSVFVKEEIPPAYQIRRYGWSAKLPISIVTDFEEFAIYDCTKKPKATDKASTARIKYLGYKEYITEFDFLWDTFSKERVLKGSFDKFVLSDTGKKGTATVDKEFLESLNEWRKLLAETISINNVKLNEDQLNFAVQQTLDRIIFLRICEDRRVEPYEKLKHCLNSPLERGTPKAGGVYSNLFKYFEEADKKYNSGLFDLARDNTTGKLNIDNKVLKKIIEELYYPVSPYEFSVLSVEILGSAYEQFLGKVIRLTPSHKARIEEKPEVRKAGGVYYTPQYIVDYIVKNTVGKLVEGKTPKEVEKIKIVDPACGSGSFLIGAYQYLLDWHLSYYMQGSDPLAKGEKAVKSPPYQVNELAPTVRGFKRGLNTTLTPDGRLTTAEKKKILINNIYGVDIDTQATEVTKLSLLLKCMEGETLSSVQQTLSFMHERILPTLENNIKSGNSLIDLDFYDGELEFAGTERKIKPFNWQAAFPEVFKLGGFDCVIGNPPYVQSREGNLGDTQKEYYYKKFKTAQYQINTFGLFIERGIYLLKINGLLGFIIPNYWLSTKYDGMLREFVFKTNHVTEIVNVYKVFESAVVDTLIINISKTNEVTKQTKVRSIDRNISKINDRLLALAKEEWSYNKTVIIKNDSEIKISFKDEVLLNGTKEIGDFFELKFGVKLYEVGKGVPKQTKDFSAKSIYEANKKFDINYKKLLRARAVKRYTLEWDNHWVKYGKNLAAPRSADLFQGKRILIQRIVSKDNLDGVYIENEYVCNTDVITLKPIRSDIDCRFFLGIINSHLCGKYIKSNNVNLDRKAFPKINTKTLESFPIPKENKVKHDEIVKHVETMLELNKELQKTNAGEEQERLKQRITYTDKKIDALVYDLYGLTEEEIKIIEGI